MAFDAGGKARLKTLMGLCEDDLARPVAEEIPETAALGWFRRYGQDLAGDRLHTRQLQWPEVEKVAAREHHAAIAVGNAEFKIIEHGGAPSAHEYAG